MVDNDTEVLKILNRRLASGEITPEEYQNLKGIVDTSEGDSVETFPKTPKADLPPKTDSSSSGEADERREPNLKKFIGWGAAAFFVFLLIKACSGSEGAVRITNLRTSGWFISTVSGTIVNDGPSGDIWIWFEQGGKNLCPRTTYMLANSEKNFSFDCYDMKEGNYTARGSKSPPSEVSNAAQSL